MNSLRRQLSRNLLTVTLVLIGGGIAALYFAARTAAIEQFDFALRAKALALSTLTIPTSEGIRVEFSDRFFRGFEDRKPRDFFELWTADGRPLARSESLTGDRDLPRRIGELPHPRFWNLDLPTGRAGRAIGFRFKAKARDRTFRAHEPVLELVVASDRDDLDDTLEMLLGIASGWGALLVGTTLWLVPRLLRRGLRSVEVLADQAGRIDAGTLSARFDVETMPIELQPIATRLNDLLIRLQRSFERERRFSADLAHELRTPVAELRSLAECALKWPQARDPATDRETLAIAWQMERLVTHMLALTRAEEGQVVATPDRVPLAKLVGDAWERRAARAAERALTVTISLPPIECLADPVLLQSIVTNLLDNAVEYAPSGTRLVLDATTDATRATLSIANEAPDLRPGDLDSLFDRFWRKDASRTAGQHFGLGLALSRAFAEAMGWTLTATLEGGRVSFAVAGPLVLAPAPVEATPDPKIPGD